MRIAIVLHQFPLVSETFILQQIQGTLARGHEVDIYASPPKGTQPHHAAYEEWKMAERVRSRPDIWLGSFQGLRRAVRLSAMPALRQPALFARCFRQSMRQGAGNPLSLFAAAASVEPPHPQRYDAIHAHFADLGLLAVRLRRLGVLDGPILTSFHGYDVTRRRSAKSLRALRALFAEGDAFTHPSDYLGECGRSLGAPAARQRKLYYGIDVAKFQFRARKLEAGSPVRIVSVARLVEKKGLPYAIAAVAQLIKAGQDLQYDIIGGGPMQDELAESIRTLGVGERIRLLGPQDSDSVRRLLSEAHIFLLPSVTAADGDMEGLPVSLLEAQACGLPIVATFHSGIPEGVADGRSGLLVPERDTAALAERLGHLASHPDLWPEMGRAGREHMEESFDIEKLSDDLIALYQSLAEPAPRNVQLAGA